MSFVIDMNSLILDEPEMVDLIVGGVKQIAPTLEKILLSQDPSTQITTDSKTDTGFVSRFYFCCIIVPLCGIRPKNLGKTVIAMRSLYLFASC